MRKLQPAHKGGAEPGAGGISGSGGKGAGPTFRASEASSMGWKIQFSVAASSLSIFSIVITMLLLLLNEKCRLFKRGVTNML